MHSNKEVSDHTSSPTSSDHSDDQEKTKRKAAGLARKYEPRDSAINRLALSDHSIQAIYDACAIHLALFLVLKVLLNFISTGRLSLDLHLLHHAARYYSLESIGAFLLTELSLLCLAVSVHPMLMVWRTLHDRYPRLPFGLAFSFLYLLGLVLAFTIVQRAVFTVSFGAAFSMIVVIEQIRLTMKTYSYIRETTKKVFTPWSKEDASGPAVWYAGQMEPQVGSIYNYLYFLFVPTLLYRDRYPRNSGPINWRNVIAYFYQCTVVLLTWATIYQDIVIPATLSHTHVLTSLLYSCGAGLIIVLLVNMGILHSWMNLNAELLRFADRQFYNDWWTATSFAMYYRKWNVIIHDWIHTYIYTDIKNLLKSYGFGSAVPAILTILVSSLIHEYMMAMSLGFCLPLISALFGIFGTILYPFSPCITKRSSNIFILFSVGIGWGLLAFCYMTEYASRHFFCPQEDQFSDFFFSSRFLKCYWEEFKH